MSRSRTYSLTVTSRVSHVLEFIADLIIDSDIQDGHTALLNVMLCDNPVLAGHTVFTRMTRWAGVGMISVVRVTSRKARAFASRLGPV